MNQPFYDYTILDEYKRYDFISIGEHIIKKTILFYKTQHVEIYSLTLADVTEDNKLDIYTVSDNGDMKKILATVLSAITTFLENYPNSKVVFSGSTPTRTRLYQISIAYELSNFESRFYIEGYTKESGFVLFTKNKTYQGFAISNRNS